MKNQTTYKDWQQWGKNPDSESRYNIERVRGNLSEMQSTKQLVKLISTIYQPGMKVLDVGCNVGHYLSGIRKKFPKLDYTGVDAYDSYIAIAKQAFKNDSKAKFEVKDIFNPLFPDKPFDIVFCCNVILHLPDFRKPVTNLLESTKKVCIIRTLLGNYTNLVKSPTKDEYDNEGNPLDYWYLNTWKKDYFTKFIQKLGWKVELIPDEFDPKAIQNEFKKTKTNASDKGTQIIGNSQVIENVLCNWMWAKITST
jgi:ubiquinone/menaquinone biosynthesis C-methylase UbiE